MFDYDYDDGENYQFEEPTWPTPSGISEAQAQQKCSDELSLTPALDSCRTLVDIDEILATCLMDIKVWIAKCQCWPYMLLITYIIHMLYNH